MARAHRLAFAASVFVGLYLLAFFQVLSVPLVDEAAALQVIPAVSQLTFLVALDAHTLDLLLLSYLK